MGGINLEIFRFGMYVMFPIGAMYYCGTYLESRFTVPGFWPKPEASNKIPFEREELQAEMERMKARRLERRARRLELEAMKDSNGEGNAKGSNK